MIACNQWLLDIGPGHYRGYTGLIQGPTLHRMMGSSNTIGILRDGELSYQIVTDMLSI